MDRVKKTLPTWVWIVILAMIVAVCGIAWFLTNRTDDNLTVAKIYVDGELVREIDLEQLLEETEFTIETDGGTNVIRARHGAICMAEADCPDQTCVKQGWIRGSATPIVCLPHRVVIQLETSQAQEIDIITG